MVIPSLLQMRHILFAQPDNRRFRPQELVENEASAEGNYQIRLMIAGLALND